MWSAMESSTKAPRRAPSNSGHSSPSVLFEVRTVVISMYSIADGTLPLPPLPATEERTFAKLTWSVATVWLVKPHDVLLALRPPASESASRRRPEKGGEAGGEKGGEAGGEMADKLLSREVLE